MVYGDPSDKSDNIIQVKDSITETFQDIITIILLQNSNLTRKQFESFLINALSESLIYERFSKERPKLRTDRPVLSRGAFDRTLAQAKKNVIESIYTIFLLAYTGLLETSQLEPFLEVGNRLRTYTDLRKGQSVKDNIELRNSLTTELSELFNDFIFKKRNRIRDEKPP